MHLQHHQACLTLTHHADLESLHLVEGDSGSAPSGRHTVRVLADSDEYVQNSYLERLAAGRYKDVVPLQQLTHECSTNMESIREGGIWIRM